MSQDTTGQDDVTPTNETPATEEQNESTSTPDTSAVATDDAAMPSTDAPVAETPAPKVDDDETSPEPVVAEAATSAEAVVETEDDDDTVTVVEDDDDDVVTAVDDDDDEDDSEDRSDADEATTADEATGPRIRRGDLIESVIVETSPTSVTVDLGDGRTGLIPGRELERMNRKLLESFAEGEKLWVYVVNPNDHQGNIILSVNRAIEEMDWQTAETYRQDQEIYEGNIAGYNKGGLIVRFGRLRGFVPQSQIGAARQRGMKGETPEERYGGMVNDKVFVKVMEVDKSRNRLILSERAATRERREARKEQLIDELAVGEVREGRVVSLEDFGAFVDVGGAEGLVHLTEIAWKHVTHPRDVLKVGQTVKVEVISVDPKRKRIGLSIKRQEADPWDEVATTYQQGDLVRGTITKLTKFGAFARLVDAEEIEGLIHISELAEQRVGHPREVVQEGDTLTLRVVKIDVKNRRLGLSLKRVTSAEFLDRDLDTFFSESDD